MSPRWQRSAALAVAVGAGAAAGALVERRAVRLDRRRPDRQAREGFGTLHSGAVTVTCDDGTVLHAEVDGDLTAPLTVVFVHGFALSMDCWHHQRRDLARSGEPVGRAVFYDQRGHGRSERGEPAAASIDQLGADLYSVLDQLVPDGPVVLVGHSMGGMTILALADRHPELFGSRICGAALVATSPGLRGEAVLGVPAVVGRALAPVAPRLVGRGRRAAVLERGRLVGSDLSYLLTRRYGFGSPPPPSVVDFVERMIAQTPLEVISEFFPTFTDHDRLAALPVLAGVDTLVLVGERDLLTPPAHSRAIAEAVPTAELVVLAEAGHMVMLERPGLVNLHLRALVTRAARRAGLR